MSAFGKVIGVSVFVAVAGAAGLSALGSNLESEFEAQANAQSADMAGEARSESITTTVKAEQPMDAGPARRDQPTRIDSIAIAPYARDQYPTTFRKFGSAVPAINADREAAAEIAATYADCDFVQNSQVTTRSPTVNRRYWVECGNLTRFYFDEKSLSTGEPVELQTKTDWIADGLKDW